MSDFGDIEEEDEPADCLCPGGEDRGACHCPYCAGGGR